MTDQNSTLQERMDKLVTYLRKATRIVFLTGAGISTDSGVPDFRSPNGIYNTTTSEEVFDIRTFRTDPERFYRAIAPLYRLILQAEPNTAHRAIYELEKFGKKEIEIVTQNIDTLHHKAGSSIIHEIHGTLKTLTCQKCEKQFESGCFGNRLTEGKVLYCDCGGVLKPDVTFFGEELPLAAFNAAERAMFNAQLLLVLGSSMTVWPAAGLPRDCAGGVPFVIINRTATLFDRQCDLIFRENISEILPNAVHALLNPL